MAAAIDIDPQWIKAPIVILLLALASFLLRSEAPYPGFPIIGKIPNDFWLRKTKANFRQNARKIIEEGLQRFSGPFQIFTSTGPKIVLPNRYVDEIRNHPDLHLGEHLSDEFFGHLTGFEAFKAFRTPLLADTIRTKLTQSLNSITGSLSQEASLALSDRLGESKEWRSGNLHADCLYIISRLATLVFIGPELCRRDDWLEVAGIWTHHVVEASLGLREWPWMLRPLVNVFQPKSRVLRQSTAKARGIIEPVVAKRREERLRNAQQQDGKLPRSADSIGWFDDVAKGQQYDFTVYQLALTGAAMHTTTMLLSHALLDICAYPEYVEPLRAEIRSAVREEGWKKTALYKMKLMDSFLKESQRLSPITVVSISRRVRKRVQLADGTVLPQGATIICSTDRMADPDVYDAPDVFDGRRFLKRRQMPGQENAWQLVTTSADHLGFGHGAHACPGRFFAANEAKVAFAHLLICYDWRFPPGVVGRPQNVEFDDQVAINPLAKVEFRRTGETLPVE